MANGGDRPKNAGTRIVSKLLASVQTLKEAQLALTLGVDIVDLKQPTRGALGALEPQAVREIVSWVDGRCPVSATIGDLPLYPEQVVNAASTMAQTQVDYIKIGFFVEGDWQATLAQLSVLAVQGHALIAVLFADAQTPMYPLSAFKAAGFKGVMLDTQDKARGSLTQLLPIATLAEFVVEAKQQGLLCGLAGSLRITDIKPLLPLHADYLGFRGALCEQQQRTADLNPVAVQAVKQALQEACIA